MRTPFRGGALAALALACLAAPGVRAGTADAVLSPVVEEGEREIELAFGRDRLRAGAGRESQTKLSFGWGATGWWFTEIAVGWKQEPGERRRLDAWEWENRFQLTETGKYPVDLGLLVEIERPKDRSEGYEVRWGPMLQADLTSRLQANLNLFWEKHDKADDAGPAEFG